MWALQQGGFLWGMFYVLDAPSKLLLTQLRLYGLKCALNSCLLHVLQEEKSTVAAALAKVGAIETEHNNAITSHKATISKVMLEEQQLRDKVRPRGQEFRFY